VRSALIASGLALPAKRITVNLAPADMPKEGSHLRWLKTGRCRQ
jgi:magnesium chelatase family protein